MSVPFIVIAGVSFSCKRAQARSDDFLNNQTVQGTY